MVSRDLIGNALVLGLVLVASMAGCRKPALEAPDAISIGEVAGEQVVPTLTTTAIRDVAGGNATSGGMVLRDGGLPVTARGVCYARHASPSLADGFTTDSTGIGAFVSQLSGLMVDSTYYVRAYATNAVGTGYGDVLSFVAGNGLPVILTTAMTVTANSAQAGGHITSTGGSAISAKGICYATSQGPSLGNGTVVPASGGGLAFTVPLTGLVNGTFYYVRAFATNTTGTAYGAQVSFTAGAPLSAPAVTTVGVTDITPTTALAEGSVDFPNGAAVTQHGFCYGTSPNPTLGDATLITGSGTGPFSGTLTGLSLGTAYYLRAFATNSAGTGYGSPVSFTTPGPPSVTTGQPMNLTSTSVTIGGEVSDAGGTGLTITARGVCYGTSPGPDLNNGSVITEGSGQGAFQCGVTGLIGQTTYYLRAYATNSSGLTGYGNQVSVTTPAPCPATVTDVDGNVYPVVQIGSQCWMAENLRTESYRNGSVIPNVTGNAEWSGLTTGALCNYANDLSNNAVYGKLYNWYAVINPDGLCPFGWHVPTDEEWQEMESTLGMPIFELIQVGYRGGAQNISGQLRADVIWTAPNSGATNASGFTALPGGWRNLSGSFASVPSNGYWWTATPSNATTAWQRQMSHSDPGVFRQERTMQLGYSCRCVKDQ